MLLESRTNPIGVDIGTHSIKAVQLGRSKSHPRVAAALSLPRLQRGDSLCEDEVRRLQQSMVRRGFVGNALLINAPHSIVVNQTMEMPARDSGAPVNQIASAELAASCGLERGAFEMGMWDLPTSGRGRSAPRVFVAACRHADANPFLDMFSEAGFDVVQMTTTTDAMLSACSGLVRQTSGISCILDFGWREVTFIAASGGGLIFERRLPDSGFKQIHQSLMERYDCSVKQADALLRRLIDGRDAGADDADAGIPDSAKELLQAGLESTFEEISISCRYIAEQFPSQSIDQFLLVGGSASFQGLADRIARTLETRCQIVRLLELADCSSIDIRDAAHPGFIGAFGLVRGTKGVAA